MKKKLVTLLMTVCLAAVMLPAAHVQAVKTSCATYSGSNVENQNYPYYHSAPVESYLAETTDGNLMRVQNDALEDGYLVEYYDTSYNILSTRTIPLELPIFGAFYETDTNYFLLTGQKNTEESEDVEVYRITKYDKDWNRLSSAGLFGSNTTFPFDAGSARMDQWGKYLLIRTSHEMYTSSDGLNHQANVTIQVDTETMTITDSCTSVINASFGYVSHSFNQFIKVEDGHIISVDHGDAYPRMLVLMKYPSDVSDGKFFEHGVSTIPLMSFPGAIGQNKTGATAGGFEISDTSYLVAGNSVVQDADNLTRSTRNIFIASTAKDTSEVKTNWITSYAEGDGTTSTPQFVKISGQRFLLLWSRDNVVYYTEINASGEQTGDIYSIAGNLSDCAPIVSGSKLIWYTWRNQTNTFYDINLDDISQSHKTVIENGHKWESSGDGTITDGKATVTCSVCKETMQVNVIRQMQLYWSETDKSGIYSSSFNPVKNVGDHLYYKLGYFSPSDADRELEMISSDPEIISIHPDSRCLTMEKTGTATITVRPKLNPEYSVSYTVSVRCGHDCYENQGIENGYAQMVCPLCGDSYQVKAPVSMTVYWNELGPTGTYLSGFDQNKNVGDILYFWAERTTPSDADKEVIVSVSDPERISAAKRSSNMGSLTMNKPGTVTVTIQSKWNPEVSHSYTINILCGDTHEWESDYVTDQEATCTEAGSKSIHCANCSMTKDSVTIAALGHDWSTSISHDESGHWYDCSRCDERKDEEAHHGGNATETQKAICEVCNAEYGALKPDEPDPDPDPDPEPEPEPGLKVSDIFVDVNAGDWFEPFAQYVYDKKIMTGTDPTHFSPASALVRAQFATILWRMEGSPAPSGAQAAFPDTLPDQFYSKAVMWASENKIVTGYTNTGLFGPADPITREQMAVMMHRYATFKGYPADERTDLSSFEDSSDVEAYAQHAVEWCVEKGIISGDGKTGLLIPKGSTNRAVCATIIERYMKLYP